MVGDAEADGVGDGVGVCCAEGLIIGSPLFQTNFFPDFTQVNFKVAVKDVAPNLVHEVPALIAASDVGVTLKEATTREIITKRFFMWQF